MAQAGTYLDPFGAQRQRFGQKLYERMINLSFTSVTGHVSFNQGSDLHSNR